jgi:ankyrin repeat protein
LTTHAERLAIHGSSHRRKLKETIQLLPVEALTQSSPEGKNAITQAIDLEDVDAVDVILEHHPGLASQRLTQPRSNNMFTYPLHFAVQMGSIRDTDESVQILESILNLDPTAINRPDSSSVRPIHAAAMGKSARILNFLLDRGSTCHDTDCRGQTPLFFCRSAAIVKTLLLRGADINHKDELGFTPVHAATIKGTEEVLHALIEGGANLSLSDNGIGAPLHCAVQRKSLSMTEMLLKAGVEVNAKDIHDRTPLLVAMNTGRSDLISLLFENGADPFIEDEGGSSPFHMALAWPNATILNKFQIHTTLITLPWETKIKALHFAAQSGEPAVLKLYLYKAFGPGLTDNPVHVYSPETRIAVHKAASVCRADLVEVLLAYGFQVDALDARGNTPLLIGCQLDREPPNFNSYSRTQICETLINNGANIYAKDHQGLTPFLIAQAHADYPLMTLLLEHALRLSDLDPSVLKSRILESIKDPEKDRQYCKESRELIGDEIIDLQLIRQAAAKEEWDFFMTCIGGHFVGKAELLQVFPRRTWSDGVDSVDILRFQSARRDRETVRYLHDAGPSGRSPIQRVSQIGERDLQMECSDLRASLNATLWPKMVKKFWRTDENGETVPRKLSKRFKKRYMEFQPRDPVNGQIKWGWSSDGLSDDLISSDEVSESESEQQNKKPKIQDQASDVDMADDNPESRQPDPDDRLFQTEISCGR